MAKTIENFTPSKVKASKAKSVCFNLCKSLELAKLPRDVSQYKSDALSVLFDAKAYKTNIPFRAIVSEMDTRQLDASHYLLNVLNSLHVTDPFLNKKCDEVVSFVEENQ